MKTLLQYKQHRSTRLSLALVLLCALSITAVQVLELGHQHDSSTAEFCLLCHADSLGPLATTFEHFDTDTRTRVLQSVSVQPAHTQYAVNPPSRAPPEHS